MSPSSQKGRNSAERAPTTQRTSPRATPFQMRPRSAGLSAECHSTGRRTEAALEAIEELARQRDFGKQDERLMAGFQRARNGFEIDFGLA